MDNGLHFISGLPRSGSTLLAAILRQNPNLHAGMSSPVGALFSKLLGTMGPQTEYGSFISNEQRVDILKSIFSNYYKAIHPHRIVFDTNRLWCSKMDALAELFPASRVVVCVRSLAWVMDSFERIVRKNALIPSKMFSSEKSATVYTRCEELGSGTGTVGYAWNAVQEAFYGARSGNLILVDYEALTRTSARTMSLLYDALGLPPFEHDFENVEYDEGGEFDERLGLPGLHSVRRRVEFVERPTILPPDLFDSFKDREFWKTPGSSARDAVVILPPSSQEKQDIGS